jgi:glycosyltransferase involved in cell wall biosynthesis
MTKLRVFFDVSALPEVGKAVTGISRVVLCVMRHMVMSHADLEVLGISFREADAAPRLWSLDDVVRQAAPLLDDLSLVQTPVTPLPPQQGDCILLLGEQWLFPGCVPTVQSLQRETGVKVLGFVHDLVPYFMPELYWDGFPQAYIDCVNSLVETCDGLLVNSRNTRKDLFTYLPQSAEREKDIHLVRLGDKFDFSGEQLSAPALANCLDEGAYILCVGTIQPRKNHLLLLAVWRRLVEVYGDRCPTLVLVGKPGWHVGDLMYFLTQHPVLKDKVRLLEQVTDGELQWLYTRCWFSVYPSLYEGWGLPIAESLAAGKLCLASDASAMPEVAGPLVDYFSPHDSGELFRLISRYLDEPALLAAREEAIRREFAATSWAQTTQQFVAAIEEVVGRKIESNM